MRVHLIFILFLTFCSCSKIGKQTILYGQCSEGYLACTQFELKKDKTFEHYVFMDVGGGKVLKGNWEEGKRDTFILNTYEQPKIPKTYYEEKNNQELLGKVKIQIKDFETPLAFANVEINEGEEKGILNEDGIIYYESKEIKNIYYSYFGIIKEKIEIKNHKMNDLEIFIKDLELEAIQRYYINEKIVIRYNKLILRPKSPTKRFIIRKSKSEKRHWK